MVLCMAEVDGKTQHMAFSKTIDAHADPDSATGRDGALNVTVNVLNVVPRRERRVGPDHKNDRKITGRASTRYWMDSLPCLSNQRSTR
jgi:hypothetical protein